jgi:hypothetical protein
MLLLIRHALLAFFFNYSGSTHTDYCGRSSCVDLDSREDGTGGVAGAWSRRLGESGRTR